MLLQHGGVIEETDKTAAIRIGGVMASVVSKYLIKRVSIIKIKGIGPPNIHVMIPGILYLL